MSIEHFCNIGQDHSMTFNQCFIVSQFQTINFIQMKSLTFILFTQVSDSGPHGPLVLLNSGTASMTSPTFSQIVESHGLYWRHLVM